MNAPVGRLRIFGQQRFMSRLDVRSAATNTGHPIIHPTNSGRLARRRRNRDDDGPDRARSDRLDGARPTVVKALLIRRFWVRIPGGAHTFSWDDAVDENPLRCRYLATCPMNIVGSPVGRRGTSRTLYLVTSDTSTLGGTNSTDNRSAGRSSPNQSGAKPSGSSSTNGTPSVTRRTTFDSRTGSRPAVGGSRCCRTLRRG